MKSSDPRQVLSRLPGNEFFGREVELGRLLSLATARSGATSLQRGGPESLLRETARVRRGANALLLGAPRVGKTEILRKAFDHLFNEGAGAVPIYYSLNAYSLDVERFSHDYLSQFLVQFIAFRRNDIRLMTAADEPLAAISRAAPPEDYLWIRAMVDSFTRAVGSGDKSSMVRCALSAPMVAALRTQLAPLVMVDNFHLLADTVGSSHDSKPSPAANSVRLMIRSEFVRALTARDSPAVSMSGGGSIGPSHVLCGLRRPMIELIPPDEELFDRLVMMHVEPMAEEPLERMIRSAAADLAIEISDSTIELMIQQLNYDLFYISALLDSASSRAAGLKTFMEFERVYTEEVLSGRISHYLGALLRDIAPDSRSRRAVLEALGLVLEASAAIPLDAVAERMGEFAVDAEQLLARLHARELMEISYGFVSASPDPVLADYVRAKYRSEIAGARRPVAGQQLLGEKLKDSYRLMMSRYNRAVESQLVELLSRFDFQGVPASLLDQAMFENRYRGMSRVQTRRSLDEEQERVRLPQVVLVNNVGSDEQPGISWQLFAASGFEGGIYSEANEVLWLIALINSKEPLDLETLSRIDQRLESAARGTHERSSHPPRVARWYISKEGFSAAAIEHLLSLRAYRSTYLQLDLLYDSLVKLAAADTHRPASEFELVIPIEDEAELIAARTVEQIARAADFDQEAINQIKTALIEACINAAEHSDSPDRRIYQRFALNNDRLIITVSNKGKAFGSIDGDPIPAPGAAPLKGPRGRGLQIIYALMDEVRLERTDDGASLIMTKFLKRPKTEDPNRTED